MPTPNYGLPLYTTDDTAELDVLLNGQSNAIDAALAANEWRAGGTDAERVALTAPRLKEGLTWYSTDTNLTWFYDGTNWVTANNGLYIVQPASVVNGTLNADGSVSISAGVSGYGELRGVFSSRFKTYKIDVSIGGSASADLVTQLMTGATRVGTASAYSNTRMYINTSNAVVANYLSDTVGRISLVPSSGAQSGSLNVYNPTDASLGTVITWEGVSAGLMSQSAISRANAAAEDGIAFTRNSGTVSGTVKVYGYA